MNTIQSPTLTEAGHNDDVTVTSTSLPLIQSVATKKVDVGHGADNTLRVTQILEENGIPCFCVGVSALKFYGACRSRSDWEICVPTDLVERAFDILTSPPHSAVYAATDFIKHPQVGSFIHTYHCLESRGLVHSFVIVPAFDVHLEVLPENIVRSLRGIPYPRLDVFTQSTLERRDGVSLCDLIDGTDVSNEWGEENLDLEGSHDYMWARIMRQRVKDWDEAKEGRPRPMRGWPTSPKSKRELWQSQVLTKAERLDWSRPPEVFYTQYRTHGSPDPWTVLSKMS